MNASPAPMVSATAAGSATAHPLIHRLAEGAGVAHWSAIDAAGARTVLGTLELGGAGDPGVTEWDGVLRPVRLKVPIPTGAVAIEVVSEGRMELDELMLLPAVTAAEFPVERGKSLTLHVASADAKLALVPGQTGSVYRADGMRVGPANRGRRSVPAGAFVITRR